MRLWRDWVLLWAIMPVATSFFLMALSKQINEVDQLAQLHRTGSLFVILLSLAFLFIAPFVVIKRHLNRYGVGAYFVCLLLFFAGWSLFLWTSFGDVNSGLFQLKKAFSSSILRLKFDPPIRLVDTLALPWWKLYISILTTTVLTFSGPVLVVCILAGRLRDFGLVMSLFLLAGLVTATSDALFYLLDIRELKFGQLNGKNWWERIAAMATWAVSSAIGATVSVIGLNRVLYRSNKNQGRLESYDPRSYRTAFTLSTVTALMLWGTCYSIYFVTGPKGIRSNFAELRKSLTLVPRQDESSGQEILRFSHVLEAPPYRFPNPNYTVFQLAPDEKTAVLLEQHGKSEGQFAIYDIVSGKRVKSLGAPLSRFERASFLWSNSAKYLAVRTNGALRIGQRYERYETKVTLYKLPHYEMVSEWESSSIGCQHPVVSTASMIMNENDELLVICYAPAQNSTKNVLAATLSVPDLNVVRLRERSGIEVGSSMRSITRLGKSTYIPMMVHGSDGRFLFADLSDPSNNIVFDHPLKLERGGRLTFQGFVTNNAEPDTVGLRFCGSIGDVSNPPEHHIEAAWGPSFCRRLDYDPSTGSLTGIVDSEETRISKEPLSVREVSISYGALEIVGVLNKLRKTGELVVTSGENGPVLQTIRSKAQIPFAVSLRNGLLFTNRTDERKIAVYSIGKEH